MTARRIAAGVTGLVLVALPVWGVLVEPRWVDVIHTAAAVPGLPRAWEGRRVALLSDLQVGMWLGNVGTGRRVVRRLLADRRPPCSSPATFCNRPAGASTPW